MRSSLSLRGRVHWHYIDTTGQVRRALRFSKSLLDVGGSDGAKWSPVWDELGLDVNVIDRNLPSLQQCQSPWKGIVASGASLPFRRASFDAVVALDVIEHLPKEPAYSLIEEMERVAAQTVIISTPYGFLPQPPASDNPYQEHISSWLPEEFEQRGYAVVGVAARVMGIGPVPAIRLLEKQTEEGREATGIGFLRCSG